MFEENGKTCVRECINWEEVEEEEEEGEGRGSKSKDSRGSGDVRERGQEEYARTRRRVGMQDNRQ